MSVGPSTDRLQSLHNLWCAFAPPVSKLLRAGGSLLLATYTECPQGVSTLAGVSTDFCMIVCRRAVERIPTSSIITNMTDASALAPAPLPTAATPRPPPPATPRQPPAPTPAPAPTATPPLAASACLAATLVERDLHASALQAVKQGVFVLVVWRAGPPGPSLFRVTLQALPLRKQTGR